MALVDLLDVLAHQPSVVERGEAGTEEMDDILVEVLPCKRARIHRHARQSSPEGCR